VFALLYEITQVNEIYEKIIATLARKDWTRTVDQSSRFGVYIAAKEYPLGSIIFFVRPTKFELLIQFASSIVGIAIAIFWAIAFK
jgi:hypothetical protein